MLLQRYCKFVNKIGIGYKLTGVSMGTMAIEVNVVNMHWQPRTGLFGPSSFFWAATENSLVPRPSTQSFLP